MTTSAAHPAVIKRLKRAQGRLKSIITMLEGERGCIEIAHQLQAVEKAIGNAKKTLVHAHIDQCLESTVREGSHNPDGTIREFKEITKVKPIWRSTPHSSKSPRSDDKPPLSNWRGLCGLE